MERAVVRRQNLVAQQQAGLRGGRAPDHPGDEGPALIVGVSEDSDPRIGHFTAGEDAGQAAMTKGARENVGELVEGRLAGGVIARMRRAEIGEHRVDDAGEVVARTRSLRFRPIARAHRVPVEPMEARVVELVAHELPDLVEGRLPVRGLIVRLGARWPRAEGERRRDRQKLPARCLHRGLPRPRSGRESRPPPR